MGVDIFSKEGMINIGIIFSIKIAVEYKLILKHSDAKKSNKVDIDNGVWSSHQIYF